MNMYRKIKMDYCCWNKNSINSINKDKIIRILLFIFFDGMEQLLQNTGVKSTVFLHCSNTDREL